jgi:hypothetical protein
VSALERRPHPTRPSLFRQTLTYQASIFPLPLRAVIANWWCFGALLSFVFTGKPKTAAVRRTHILKVLPASCESPDSILLLGVMVGPHKQVGSYCHLSLYCRYILIFILYIILLSR